MNKYNTIGVDLAKNVIQVCVVSPANKELQNKELTRKKFTEFLGKQKPALVAFVACATAHYWSRVARRHGHQTKTIPALAVAPFRQGHKTDQSVNAALITVGNLTTYDDGSSNIISDSLYNVEYLRLDVLADLTYAQTLAVLGSQDGGGWRIASSSDALGFTNAMLGGFTRACTHDGTNVTSDFCGRVTGWTDGLLGNNFDSLSDYAWFLDITGRPDYIKIVGQTRRLSILNGGDIANTDIYSTSGGEPYHTIPWLLVRGEAMPDVPVPAAVWLFGSGLLVLIGVARRKTHI